MPTQYNRKLVTISIEAYEHLLKIRDAQAKAMNFRLVTITDCATNLILSIPIPNGNGSTPAAPPPTQAPKEE